jgi:glycine/D-amino acid oxidase-like deaminating enzyme
VKFPGYELSQYDRAKQPEEQKKEAEELKEEVQCAKQAGLDAEYVEGFVARGCDGEPDQRDAAIFRNQAAFHPTKYLIAVLNWLKTQPNFAYFTHTRAAEVAEKGLGIGPIGSKDVEIKTMDRNTISASNAVMATCVPLHKLSIVAEMKYMYCIAVRIPKNSVEDCLLYDLAEAYKYVRLTGCEDRNDYLVIGGCDHKVGKEEPIGRFKELETWTRERFTKAGAVDSAWSGQVFVPVGHVAFIGRDPGTKHTWIVTGDSGNGLTHAVMAGDILASEIEGKAQPWSCLYRPERTASILKSAKEMIPHDLRINAQYKRFLQSDIEDFGDLPNGEGLSLSRLLACNRC